MSASWVSSHLLSLAVAGSDGVGGERAWGKWGWWRDSPGQRVRRWEKQRTALCPASSTPRMFSHPCLFIHNVFRKDCHLNDETISTFKKKKHQKPWKIKPILNSCSLLRWCLFFHVSFYSVNKCNTLLQCFLISWDIICIVHPLKFSDYFVHAQDTTVTFV